MIQYAALAIASGQCQTVACVFSDAPLKPPRPAGEAKGGGGSAGAYAFGRGLEAAYGQFGVNAMYAMVAQRHMHLYGTTNDHLGAVAVAERQWANRNPAAQFHDTPMTLDDYHRSRWVVEPFHLFDCCLVSNGGLAVIVTSAERARDAKRPPVYLLGMGQGHPGGDPVETLTSGAPLAKEAAFAMAGIAPRRHRRRRAVRLLHVHGARHARGLRLLREGRGRPVRRRRPHRAGRHAAAQHRRRSALVLLHVGHDADLGSRDPAARRRRRAPGRRCPRRPGQRQRRHPVDALDPGAVQPAADGRRR